MYVITVLFVKLLQTTFKCLPRGDFLLITRNQNIVAGKYKSGAF